jgi:hypothetical protein
LHSATVNIIESEIYLDEFPKGNIWEVDLDLCPVGFSIPVLVRSFPHSEEIVRRKQSTGTVTGDLHRNTYSGETAAWATDPSGVNPGMTEAEFCIEKSPGEVHTEEGNFSIIPL